MAFTPEEIVEIEEAAKISPMVRKLWAEIKMIDEDAGARFYKSLVAAVIAITGEVDAVHTGKYNQFKILKGDPKTFKRIFLLLTKSKPIIDGLAKAKKLIEPKKVKPKVAAPIVSQFDPKPEEEEEEGDMSFTDRQASVTTKKQ